MLILKEGYPERSELLICTVTKIQFNSIFVSIDEYQGKQGIIHISEISPGRIRNIRDYVKEGKVIVCVVLRVNMERDLIELSLRRVQEGQRRNKINEMKLEQKAEKLIEFVARSQETDPAKLVRHIIDSIKDEYDTVHGYFEDIVLGDETIDRLKLPPKTSKALLETITTRIKLPEVIIKGRFELSSFDPSGNEMIKEALARAKKTGGESLSILYLGAGKYGISIKSEDYKTAEKVLENVVNEVTAFMKKNNGLCSFSRTDK